MTKKASMIDTLWVFPSDGADPIEVMNAILGWANNTNQPTYSRIIDWIMAQYDVNISTARAFLKLLIKLWLLEGVRGGTFKLSDRAKQMIAEPRDRMRLLSDQFLRRCLGMVEVLENLYDWEELYESDLAASLETRFPMWRGGTYLAARLHWLRLLHLIVLVPEPVERLRITQFGESVFANHDPAHLEPVKSQANDVTTPQFVTPSIDTSKNSPLAAGLITELHKASYDSESPRRMELAVAEVFRFLGFHTRHLGRSGEGDVLINANLGARSYRIIADAKSRQDGRLLSLDGDTLNSHRAKENADYSLVVAQTFIGPKVADTAERYGVILLPVNTLIRLINFHDGSPLTPDIYRIIFSQPGIRYDIPPEFNQIIEERCRYLQLLSDVIETIQEAYQHGLTYSLSSSQLLPLMIMRQRGVLYTEDEIQQALDLLAYPGIHGILDDNMMQIDLCINRPTLVRTFHVMANQISTMERKMASG